MSRRHGLSVALLLTFLMSLPSLAGASPSVSDGPTVSIRDMEFPLEIAIGAGETVTWVNDEPAMPHDVVDTNQAFSSPMLMPGEAFSFTFSEAGTYEYLCSLHPAMRGAVVVTDSGMTAPTTLASGLLAGPVAGQELRSLQANVTVVASGLLNPRGFTFAPDGALIVAESGAPPPGFQPVGLPPPDDFIPGATRTGRITRFDLASGDRTTLADGLPSAGMFLGDTLGPTSVAYLGADLYVAIAAGPVHGWPFFPSGVYRVNPDGTVRMIGNTDAFNLRNPVAFVPPDEEISNPYDMVAAGGALWVSDGNVNQIYRITPGAPVSRAADLSVGHPVTTGIAPGADGSLVVVELTAVPFLEGSGRILRIGSEGQVEELFRGTTVATGVAVAPDGTIYVVEHSISLGAPPFLQPFSGRVARLANGQLETVVGGLMFPTMARIGPDGALYVANFSVGGDNGEGQILRVDLGAGQ